MQVKRVRTLRLAVQRDGTLRMSVPYGRTENEIRQFVRDNKDWIVTHTTKVRERYEREKSKEQHRFEDGELFTFLGRDYPLHYIYKECEAHVELSDNAILLVARPDVTREERAKAINNWYFMEMKAIVNEMLAQWLPIMEEKPIALVRYKVMKSRWGSCKSSERILCFNMRLVFYPRESIEAVVVHELCHLKELSHNARFHALMRHYLPDYKEREKALKER